MEPPYNTQTDYFNAQRSFQASQSGQTAEEANAQNSGYEGYGAYGDDALATASVGIASLINNVLIAHPCTVLRRQCQVHQHARKQHLMPFTLLPVIAKIVAKDGVWTLWKGAIGTGVLWSISKVSEVVIADVFGLPRGLIPNGSSEKFWRHVYLRASTFFVSTPFIVSSFVETVRSSTGFSIEDTKVLEVFFRGVDRLRLDFFGAKDNSRRFSLVYLSIPNVLFNTGRFMISNWFYNTIYNMARRYVCKKPLNERTRFHAILPEMFATITSAAISDVICYPIETVIHRLYIQGTRTLIDNLDTGASAISVTAKYTGFLDCLKSIVNREGFSALYSGVGAIGLQYVLQFLVLRTMRTIFEQTANRMDPVLQQNVPFPSTSPVMNQSMNAAPSAQFNAVTEAEQYNLQSSFPTFAQTASSAASNWPDFRSTTLTTNPGASAGSLNYGNSYM
ncbi:Solute carrier family 25 member 46 [Aphelenchoides besseyi]|nr:Solute carrier family 25 member 46 [Aphelenchoides besseyi]KAI6208327.1 Solute carrier family 25 member 46 [Aphelenchoides besseyi]